MKFKKLFSFLLVFVLVLGLVPQALAAETTEPATMAETTIPDETTIPTEAEETTEATKETVGQEDEIALASADDGIMVLSGEQLSGVKLLNLASPYNYTCTLSSQVYVTYIPAGTSTTKRAGLKNIGWHYYSYNGVQDKDKTIYCIEPYKDFAQGTSGNYVDEGVDVWGSNSTGSIGSNAWYALSSSQRRAIAYILQYSENRWDHSVSVTSVSKANNPNYPLRIATQVLIYEVVMGLRDPDSFVRLSSNGYTAGNVLYNAFSAQVSNFSTFYDGIAADVQAAETIPSFCSASSSSAPTITLEGDLTWVTDSNGVCGEYTFTEDNNDVWFNVYSDRVGMQNPYGFTGTKLYSCYRSKASSTESRFNVFYSYSSSSQACVSLQTAATDNMYGYFKVYAEDPTGSLSITKTTSDNQNLSGWQFSIYTDPECTSLLSGSHITDENGTVTIEGLNDGTVYVKEMGNTNPEIEAKYVCSDTNPQSSTITAGETVTVSFHNVLNFGSIQIIKATDTGEHLEGWQFGVYTDVDCTSPIPGSPFTSGTDGTVTVSNLSPGTYYVAEIAGTDPYWEYDTEVHEVIVEANTIADITITNCMKNGSISIHKVNRQNEPLAGATFRLEWSEDGTAWEAVHYTEKGHEKGGCTTTDLKEGCLTTGQDGNIRWDGLYPGLLYRVSEVSAPEGYVLLSDFAFEGQLPEDDWELELQVVNGQGFVMPETGAKSASLLRCAQFMAMAICASLLYVSVRRRKW